MKNEIESIFLPEREKEDVSHFFLNSGDYGGYDISLDDEYLPEDYYEDLFGGGDYDFEY